MRRQSAIQHQVGDQIAMHNYKVAVDEGSLVHVTEDITSGPGVRDTDELEDREWTCSRGGRPPRPADVILHLIGVGAAVDVNFVDAIHGKKFESIFDEGCVG